MLLSTKHIVKNTLDNNVLNGYASYRQHIVSTKRYNV
jgi:hypothetical protein